jgi:hypothetical protein
MTLLKEASRWDGGEKVFVIISEVEADDGHQWVHYREETGTPPNEYSCYRESFLQRFRPLPD